MFSRTSLPAGSIAAMRPSRTGTSRAGTGPEGDHAATFRTSSGDRVQPAD